MLNFYEIVLDAMKINLSNLLDGHFLTDMFVAYHEITEFRKIRHVTAPDDYYNIEPHDGSEPVLRLS